MDAKENLQKGSVCMADNTLHRKVDREHGEKDYNRGLHDQRAMAARESFRTKPFGKRIVNESDRARSSQLSEEKRETQTGNGEA